jgi:hypothetical protein
MKHALEIYIQDFVPLLVGHIDEGGPGIYSRVVD